MPLKKAAPFLPIALDQASNPVLVTDARLEEPGPRILYINQAFTRMTGYQWQDLEGKTPRILQGRRTDRQELARLSETLKQGREFKGSNVNYRKDGSPYLVEWNISPVKDEIGQITHFISIQRDISQRREEEHFSRTLLKNIGEGVFGVDAEGRFTFINPAGLKLLGYSHEEELLGQNSHQLIHHSYPDGRSYPTEACPIHQAINSGLSADQWHEDWFWRQDASGFPVEIYATPLWQELGQVFGGVVTFRDISERKRLEGELQQLAYHDQLTQLYNRHAFYELLEQEAARAQRYQTRFSLVMFDLDYFKKINDNYGHHLGDQVLIKVAELATERMRINDAVCRWGGEEFMVLLPETSLSRAAKLAEAFRKKLEAACFPEVGRVTASLGVVEYCPDESLDQLTLRADTALYEAKEAGRNQVMVGY
ncbi:PAS domain S-box-containing protein/diguanylate cyclase (GGDEF) domain-containing protein [Marinospirillum celere]|uniref:PAS domain S-box-containing protein/diguanylate cyclase (GGDEF) domain-containing protein n=1 Tax=Marinospirillum celere TaxID=1122252 RepID=A0A1I1JQZ2_9GAMM|nr:sensor domain-containing diguanylate cyclase [Marinospirillum celere]SFC48283.1 PAS domain S-box-containing protein/diguanylate cyclase (GGDEF) domain-containing protein [Marinospirillum celere]